VGEPTQPLPNSRATPRVDTNTRATVTKGTRKVPFTINNLSLGGARLVGPLALQKGQRIEITLELDSGTVSVIGEVVRVDTPDLMDDQIAVRFLEPSPEARAAVRDVVMRTLKEPGDADDDFDDEVVIERGDD
jgi:hypothetical protein